MYKPKKPNLGNTKLTSNGMQVSIGSNMSVSQNGLNFNMGNGLNLEVGTGKINTDFNATSDLDRIGG